MKLIREARMAPPKSYKTGSVGETYPLPMLFLQFDQDGCDVICKREVRKIKPIELDFILQKPETVFPQITEIAYYDIVKPTISALAEDAYVPQNNIQTYKEFVANLIKLSTIAEDKIPFRTVVLDGLSSLQRYQQQHMVSCAPKRMEDARNWAGAIGANILKLTSVAYSIRTNVVILCHDVTQTNDKTDKVETLPYVYGTNTKKDFGGMPSQFFYQRITNGKALLYTKPVDYVSGIGARWPQNLPNPCGCTYKEIYETEYKPQQ